MSVQDKAGARLLAGAAVHVQGLGKRFGRTWAVRDVSFELPKGALLLVVGPNGAGKSTLLGLLSTLLRPTSGLARIFGRDVLSEGDVVRRSVGFLSHQPMLYPQLSVQENLTFFAAAYGSSRAEGEERVAQLLRDWGLTGVVGTPVAALSHGTLRRAALARAVLHAPGLLLLDEPYAGLDRKGRALLGSALEELRAGGTTVVLAAHDVGPSVELADTVAVLSTGELRGYESRRRWSASEVQDFYSTCTAY